MEKIILQRIRWIAAPHHARAMGFKPASGTRDAIATLVHDLSACKASTRRKAAAVYLDLKQAFELVQKNAILYELVDAGISGNILKWCEDFLTNRQAHLSLQGAYSTIKEFENGTPQGSCLSPCFFNYAMNVFLKLKLPPGVKMLTYADDIVLYCDTHSNPMKQLQTALDLLTHTATDAGFMFAPAKTKAMCFFAGNPETQLKINNQQIEWTDDHNYLGVIIDKQLRFHKHVEHIADRTQSASNALKVLGSLSGLSCSLLRRVFMATVRAIIDYGAEFHNMMSNTQLEKLQRKQNSALSSCLGVPPWTATDNVHAELKMLPVNTRTDISQAKFVHKVLSNVSHPLHIYIDAEATNPHDTHRHKRTWIAKSVSTYKKLADHAHHEIQNEVQTLQPDQTMTTTPAPWETVPVKINFNTQLPSKNSTATITMRRMAEESLHDLRRPIFYTDGSVHNQQAGAGVIHENTTMSVRLNDGASILQAELAAIDEALQQAKNRQYNTAVVVTDSKAALLTIDSTTPEDNTALIKNIHRTASEFINTPELIWVPAHVGVQGNERADAAAKTALSNNTVKRVIETSRGQTLTHIRKKAIAMYETHVRCRPSRSVAWNQELKITEEERKLMWKLPRQIQKDLSKLRTFTRTRRQIIDHQDTCHYCDYLFVDYAAHYLTECPANRIRREKLVTGNMYHIGDSRQPNNSHPEPPSKNGTPHPGRNP